MYGDKFFPGHVIRPPTTGIYLKSNGVLDVLGLFSNGVLDFLFQHNNKIYPIEVKAGKTGTLKSLQVYLAEKGEHTGIRFNLDLPAVGTNLSANIMVNGELEKLDYTLISLPLYFAGGLSKVLNKLKTKFELKAVFLSMPSLPLYFDSKRLAVLSA